MEHWQLRIKIAFIFLVQLWFFNSFQVCTHFGTMPMDLPPMLIHTNTVDLQRYPLPKLRLITVRDYSWKESRGNELKEVQAIYTLLNYIFIDMDKWI